MFSSLPRVGFWGTGNNLGMSRYTEALLMEGDYYKELQYWLSVYNRAQQFGLPNTSIAEISGQIYRVSQKLSNLRQIVKPYAENLVKADTENNNKASELFASQ